MRVCVRVIIVSCYSKLLSALQNSEAACETFISKEELEHICRIEQLPLSDQLIQASMMKYGCHDDS